MLTVTRKRSRASRPMGCSAIEGAAPTWTFDDGHSSRGTRVSRTKAARQAERGAGRRRPAAMSSMIRTPWPSRSAPHTWRASAIEGRPNASPAWMVMWKLLAHHAGEGVQVARRGIAGLGPRDVEAAHALVAVAQGQLGDLQAAGPLAHGRAQHPHGQVAAREPRCRTRRARPRPPRRGVRPRSMWSSGAKRISAYTMPSSARSSAHSAATRSSASRVCITADRVGEGLQVEHRGRCGWRRAR